MFAQTRMADHSAGPQQLGFLAAASDEMIRQTLQQGREGTPMGSFLVQGLTERDIDDVVSYVHSFEQQ